LRSLVTSIALTLVPTHEGKRRREAQGQEKELDQKENRGSGKAKRLEGNNNRTTPQSLETRNIENKLPQPTRKRNRKIGNDNVKRRPKTKTK
jgi:hypothetical protein